MKKKLSVFLITVFLGISINSCSTTPELPNRDFRQEMRDFVIGLSSYAKTINPAFIIIPQNGQELVTDTGEGDGTPQTEYLAAIDATGREAMLYGYTGDDIATPTEVSKHFRLLCRLCEANGVEVLVTDYCSNHSKIDNSYQENSSNGFISFAADQRNLNNIPDYPALPYPHTNVANTNYNVTTIAGAKNFLYIIDSESYDTKQLFLDAVKLTNYDMVLIDLYDNDGYIYTQAEIESLKTKKDGGSRLVIAYMSIGEAENYRYYWQSEWTPGNPDWLDKVDPNWAGNYYVRYWNPEWQAIIFGNANSYLKKIINAGFDGVYLDLIDAFEIFENY